MAETEFELFNNQLLQQVVGAGNAHISIIEEALNVEIETIGNHIRIKGEEESCRDAKEAIEAIYSKVSRGISVGEQEVRAAVRMNKGDI